MFFFYFTVPTDFYNVYDSKLHFFPFQIKIAIGSEDPNGSLESHFPII